MATVTSPAPDAANALAAPNLIGQRLIDRGAIGPADLERALDLQGNVGGRLGSLLVRIGALSEEQLQLPLAGRDIPLPEVEAWQLPGDPPVAVDWMQDQQVLLWQDADGGILCASRDPLDPALRETLDYLFPASSVPRVLIATQFLESTLDRLAQGQASGAFGNDEIRHLRELAEEAPVVELVNSLLAQAVEQRASDIHLEPDEHQFVVRFRLDGVLYTRLQLPRERFNAVASRLKLISGMDIAKRRLCPECARPSAHVPQAMIGPLNGVKRSVARTASTAATVAGSAFMNWYRWMSRCSRRW